MRYDQRDFQKIDETYRPKIHRYLTRLVGEHEAEDMTQEVLVKISRALKTFRGESQLSTWIYRIATNTARDKLRSVSFHRDARISPLTEVIEFESRAAWTREASSPEQKLMRKEMYQCFMSFVHKLPLNYRTVVVLSELEELTDKEIAATLGLSLSTVKIRLHRGRTRLFKELKAYCKPEDWL